MIKNRPAKTPAPIGKGRSAQSKTVKGKVSSQEKNLGGHREDEGGGKPYKMPKQYESPQREADLSAGEDTAPVG